jgi:hypothetical protein
MEWYFWVFFPALTTLGVLTIRYAPLVTDAFYANEEPDHSAKEQPSFYANRTNFDPRSREVRLVTVRLIGVVAVAIGLGGFLLFALA